MNKQIFRLSFITIFYLTNISFVISINKSKTAMDSHSYGQGEREVDFKIIYKISVKGHLDKLKLKMIIPADIKDRQKINKLIFSIKPDSIYSSNNNYYALYKFKDLTKDFKIVLKGRLVIFSTIKFEADSTNQDFSKYLIAEENIEVGSEKVISVAKTLKQRTDIETIMKTFEYVTNHIRYEKNDAIGAAKVLEIGIGKCMDYSDLFVALLRANNIPAKSIFGIVVDELGKNPLHAWPEAYLQKQGWIRFDPTTGNSEIISNGKNYKLSIDNTYITLSEGRNDPELRTSILYYYLDPLNIEKVKIDVSFDIAGQ